jgi:hypothetical protein
MITCPLTTREAVKAALDVAETVRANAAIDEAIAAATETVEGTLHRTFRPYHDTKVFDWPHEIQPHKLWRLWLDANELISATSITSGGTTLTTSDYELLPNSGPPYNQIRQKDTATNGFSSGSSWMNSFSIVGLWGYRDDEITAGQAAAALTTTTATTLDVTDGSVVGVGDLLRIDTERLQVTERTWLTTSTTITSDLSEADRGRTVAVSDGTAFHVGEFILIDSETMWITSITGNNLAVRRAWDGSTLAAHSNGATVYASRRLTVTRGARGSTAATHLISAPIYRHVCPTLATRFCRAEALVMLNAERAAYAMAGGSGNAENPTSALVKIKDAAVTTLGRKVRMRSS